MADVKRISFLTLLLTVLVVPRVYPLSVQITPEFCRAVVSRGKIDDSHAAVRRRRRVAEDAPETQRAGTVAGPSCSTVGSV
jgi:hypothetical protein